MSFSRVPALSNTHSFVAKNHSEQGLGFEVVCGLLPIDGL